MDNEIFKRIITEEDGEESGIFDYRSYELSDWLLSTEPEKLKSHFKENPEEKKIMIQFAKMYYDFAIELDKAVNDI